jgi:predicted GNAT superfamily acetyltransferase
MTMTGVAERTARVTVRPLDTPAEMQAGVEVYREAFALSAGDPAVSPRLLCSLRHNAGAVIGAFAGDRLVGFVYGFLAFDQESGQTYHYSQMAAVHPTWQGRGVGRALKQGQREFVLAMGVETMRWAFDPARSQNAHFNLDVLGAVARWFMPNMYGEEPYGRDAGLRTDRLVVDWALTEPPRDSPARPAAGAWGIEVEDGDDLLLSVPRDWLALVAAQPERAAELRANVATTLERLIKRGYAAVSCQGASDEPGTAVYRFVPS